MKQTIRWMAGVATLVVAPTLFAQGSHQPAASTATAAVATVFNPVVPPVTNTAGPVTVGGVPAVPSPNTPVTPMAPPPPPPPGVPPLNTPAGLATATASLNSAGVPAGVAGPMATGIATLTSGAPITAGGFNQAATQVNTGISSLTGGTLRAVVLQTAQRVGNGRVVTAQPASIASSQTVSLLAGAIGRAIAGEFRPGS